MLSIVTCYCSSSDSLVRNFLKSVGYSDWLSVPIAKGREKSLRALERLPRTDEREMLRNFLKEASKWAVIIGWTDRECRWADITHNVGKSRIDARFIVEFFG